MTFEFPYRIKLEPTNKLVGFLFRNYKLDIVIMSHGRIARLRNVKMSALEDIWVTGIELIKVPPFHKIVLVEEMV